MGRKHVQKVKMQWNTLFLKKYSHFLRYMHQVFYKYLNLLSPKYVTNYFNQNLVHLWKNKKLKGIALLHSLLLFNNDYFNRGNLVWYLIVPYL